MLAKMIFRSATPRALLWSALLPIAASAQQIPAKLATAEETINLSEFRVSAAQTSAYQAKEANSAGRIRMALSDTPQSITVITQDFMEDIGTSRALDAMKFSASVTEGQFPNRLDRLTIRGFQQDAAQQSQFVDGFRFTAISAGFNADAANLDRIEIVKGPNAIIAAAGSPGGSINFISKSPKFNDAGYVKVQVGQYLANRVEVDKTGPLPWKDGKSAAYRVVAMATDSKGYQGNQTAKTYLAAPSFTVLLGRSTDLTVKSFFMKTRVSSLNLPIDPRVGIDNTPVLYPGLTRRTPLQGHDNVVVGSRMSGSIELTHKFSENFQTRLGGMAGLLTSDTPGGGAITGRSLGGAVGNIDPLTGIYTPGTIWTVRNYGTTTQTVTSAPAAFPDFADRTGYNYSVGRDSNKDTITALQNDYVYKLELPAGIRSSVVAGVSANTHNYTSVGYANRNTPLVGTLDNPDFVTSFANALALPSLKNRNLNELETTSQAYVAGVVRMFDDKLITSGSYSYFDYLQRVSATSMFGTNPVGTAVAVPPTPGYVNGLFSPTPGYDKIKGHKSNSSFGLVYKPVKNISLFYGRSQNTNPPTLNNIGGTSKANQFGDQYEFGTKSSFLDGACDITLTRFNLVQHNVFVYDFVSNTYLPLGDVTSKGYELEINARISPELTVIGAASSYKAREGFGRRLRSAPDQSGALALRYQFTSGPLKSAWLMFAADYLDKRAGEIPGTINIDAASAARGTVVGTVNGRTLTGIPVQPSFYLQGRTILNFTGGYTLNKNWKLWVKVENLLDKNYIQAALNRGTVTPGNPRNVTSSATYKF